MMEQDSRIGVTLNDQYEVLGLLHETAMSRVYSARDTHKDRPVIVKFALYDGDPANFDNIERLEREAVALACLDHPRIVRAIASRPYGKSRYLVLEHLAGASIGDMIQAKRRLGPAEAVRILAQVLEGLGAVHGAGLVHRDVKSDNVIATDEDATIIDFGCVALACAIRRRAKRMTGPHRTLGTPMFMAPEQCQSERDLDGRVDIYASGLMFYEMLTGYTLIPNDRRPSGIVRMHISGLEPLFDDSDRFTGISEAHHAFIRKASARRPCDRFQTAEEARLALLKTIV